MSCFFGCNCAVCQPDVPVQWAYPNSPTGYYTTTETPKTRVTVTVSRDDDGVLQVTILAGGVQVCDVAVEGDAATVICDI